jgi:dTDP-4-amino-4,6-dideoxygalactose transaminase
VKLRRLDGWTTARQLLARAYRQQLPDKIRLVAEAPATPSVHHLTVARTQRRDTAVTELGRAGIETGIHYPVPCHLQQPYLDFPRDALPVTELAALQIFSLPMFPHMTPAQVTRVCDVLSSAVSRVDGGS